MSQNPFGFTEVGLNEIVFHAEHPFDSSQRARLTSNLTSTEIDQAVADLKKYLDFAATNAKASALRRNKESPL